MELLNINYEKYKLDNGLNVILYPDHSIPLTAINLWYKVGSANEVKGKTGLAHLFEHMMFQGSENVPKEMHFRYIQEAGGSLNGSTSFDRTNYYEKLPSNSFELALWLESDRMGYLLNALTQEKLDNQKSVVANERLERYDNQPYGLAWETILQNLFPDNHPYSWATIGFLNDIKSYTLDDVRSFFTRYYSPSNASLVIAGNLNIGDTKKLIEDYFGSIPSSNHISEPEVKHFKLNKNIIIEQEDNVELNRIYLTWQSDKIFTKDDSKLDVLADVLTGSKNSRLYKKLVFEDQIAQDVSSFQYSAKYAGMFMIAVTAKPGTSLDEIKKIIFNEIENLISNGISEKELIKTKNIIKANFIYSMQSIENIADRINMYNFYLNEPDRFNYDLDRYQKVNKEDIQFVCKKYLNEPYVELRILTNRNK